MGEGVLMFIRQQFKHYDYTLDYLIDFPSSYVEGNKYPVMFYIHGYGLVGDAPDRLESLCPLRRERLPEDLPFILVAPQCREKSWLFIFETLNAFVDDIISKDFCDDKKVYLSGSSMGGYASWMLIQADKDRFASAVICCGGGQYWAAGIGAFNGPAIRAVHGKNDNTVLPRESQILVERINLSGGNAELRILDSAHDVWTPTFTDTETYYWLNSHSK